MSSKVIENTFLWRNSLASRDADDDNDDRARLRTAFWSMRENVIPFVQGIHRDLLGLTVHDETHLDALWQTADLVCGPNFELNPLEAFVFGASVLLHDTAMALAAYPGGLKELQSLQLWEDVAAQYGEENKERIQFTVLRELHAEQAEELARISFRREGRSENLFLLEDTKLRDSLGDQIGRIAHSHHWDHRDLVEKLNKSTGGIPGYNTTWTVNEVKVACILRCADAAHVDARRAPTFLYAISDIGGISDSHWKFQNKLNQPATDGDKLVFSSGSDFLLDDASAWWVCHDTLRMIDGEIKSCNAILTDESDAELQVSGVKGIESPQLLSRYVKVRGWSPVDAEVRVSDPVHLAKTLGGENLYGNDPLPPIREVLQNAVDAIRARRVIEQRGSDWGQIRITIELGDSDSLLMHIDDQGVGMSERVLTGPLIDFGNSFWGSDLARHEFPGLISGAPDTIGKFGIGFFAVFLLGDEVSVASRKYDAGRQSEKVLSFQELSRRPLLRPAVTGEIPRDFSTRVSVALNASVAKAFKPSENSENHSEGAVPEGPPKLLNLEREIRKLICALDVQVDYRNEVSGNEFSHSARWQESPAETFLEEAGARVNSEGFRGHVERLRPMFDDEGNIVGRAAFTFNTERYSKPAPLISVGGFTSYSNLRRTRGVNLSQSEQIGDAGHLPSMIGVVLGQTSDAARKEATPKINRAAVERWAEEQAKLIEVDQHLDQDLVVACTDLMRARATVENLPFAIVGGRFSEWPKLQALIENDSPLYVSLRHREYSDKIVFRSFDSLGPIFTSGKVKSNVVVLNLEDEVPGFDEEDVRGLVQTEASVLSEWQVSEIRKEFELNKIFAACEECWGQVFVRLRHVDITSEKVVGRARFSWVLAFEPNEE